MDRALTKELELLFDFAPPESLQRSLRTVLFSYLMNMDKNMVPEDFNTVISDLYYLTDFIEMGEDPGK